MVNRTPAPVNRLHTRSQRETTFFDQNEPGIVTQLNLVPVPEGPSELVTDPGPDTGIPSNSQEPTAVREDTMLRLCDESVDPMTKRITEYEGNVSVEEARIHDLKKNMAILPDKVIVL